MCVCVCPDCLFVWSDQCVIVCPLSLTLLLPVTPEAIGFLSTVGLVTVLLTIFLLFINKKLCFSRVGGLPCLEQSARRKKPPGMRQGLGEWLINGETNPSRGWKLQGECSRLLFFLTSKQSETAKYVERVCAWRKYLL